MRTAVVVLALIVSGAAVVRLVTSGRPHRRIVRLARGPFLTAEGAIFARLMEQP